jgi:predicted nucleic acid-binding protein
MIILDTNIISELMRAEPEPLVVHWIDAQPLRQLATTAINIAEIRRGLARLPLGRRRRNLEIKFDGFAARAFAGRVFDFDTTAADAYGDVVVARERIGRPLDGFDGLIAAIARSRGATIATRNVGDFDECGIAVTNPWRPAAAP